jgi:hypothetical protein
MRKKINPTTSTRKKKKKAPEESRMRMRPTALTLVTKSVPRSKVAAAVECLIS